MKILNLYGPFIENFDVSDKKTIRSIMKGDPRLHVLQSLAEDWGIELDNVLRWMKSHEYAVQRELALKFVEDAPTVVKHIEKIFSTPLLGEIRLSPSLMRFDGFARYDSGSHTVWFGVDHPDATYEYLEALMSHELSHVYRDHQPRVWAHLKKPLEKVTRDEYLKSTTGEEHLISEGLATLFSQVAYPKIPLHVHHYYFPEELEWCLRNFDSIDKAIRARMKKDQDVWTFYEEDSVAPGSPSRTQYFWAARVLSEWLLKKRPQLSLNEAIIESHRWPIEDFDCFKF